MEITNKTLLITDIDGFIGSRASEISINKGMKVCGLQINSGKSQISHNREINIIPANITSPKNLQSVTQGVDIVLHTQELAKESGKLEEFQKVNVEGTVNIAKAAKDSGVGVFVYISSALVYGFEYPENVTEEQSLPVIDNPYCQTKQAAEKALMQLNSPSFGVIIIRPGDVYGPGCIPWIIRPLLMMRQKLFAYAGDGKGICNHLYIDNLIDAIFLALEKEAYGEIFNITDGQETSWKNYFTSLAEIENLPVPSSLPKEIKTMKAIYINNFRVYKNKFTKIVLN